MRNDFFDKLHEYLDEASVPPELIFDIEHKIRREFGTEAIYINVMCKKKRNRELIDDFLKSDQSTKTIDVLCGKYGITRSRFLQIKNEYLT